MKNMSDHQLKFWFEVRKLQNYACGKRNNIVKQDQLHLGHNLNNILLLIK